MKKIYQIILIVILSTSCALTYATTNSNDKFIAVSAYLGGRYSNDFKVSDDMNEATVSHNLAQALGVSWFYQHNTEGELLYSTAQHTVTMQGNVNDSKKMQIHYLQFGGRVWLTNNSPFSTSIGLGIGGTLFDPKAYSDEIYFSGNISGGIRYKLNDDWAVKSDLRVYSTILSSNSTAFCANNQCLIYFDNEAYVQVELMAGVQYQF
ncbi:MAG: outer membrane beta-barrel protein [Psychromonas sp.]|nr:outer membrane beta-barrel protein [Psychromonas sp.]